VSRFDAIIFGIGEARALHRAGVEACFQTGQFVLRVWGHIVFVWGRVIGQVSARLALAGFLLTTGAYAVHAAPLSLLPPQAANPVETTKPGVTDIALIEPSVVQGSAMAVAPLNKRAVGTRYNIVVLGDSLGDGVWAGLYHALRRDKRFNVIKKSKVATGLVRHDYYDWNDVVREVAADTRIDIAVVVLGTNDRQPIVENGKRYALFDPNWRKVYDARINDFTATLKKTGARIYWVGLPVMRGATFEKDMETFSQIFKTRAAANGINYLPLHDVPADKDGNYQAYGLDAKGRQRLLRAEDGIHFTMAGYDQLVKPIVRLIRQDVDRGAVFAGTPQGDRTVAAIMGAQTGETAGLQSASAIGLKAQIYDVAEGRPGRSDDWRWIGDAH
jgi:hypothetical protein